MQMKLLHLREKNETKKQRNKETKKQRNKEAKKQRSKEAKKEERRERERHCRYKEICDLQQALNHPQDPCKTIELCECALRLILVLIYE